MNMLPLKNPIRKQVAPLAYYLLFSLIANAAFCQKNVTTNNNSGLSEKNYLATSVFVLTSLIPGDNTYFYEIDYGRKINAKTDLVFGLNVYNYTAPMSIGWSDNTTYPGHVFSYGAVFACQYYLWKNLFVDQIFNPLFLDYYPESTSDKSKTGFMLLCATRVGYHFDLKMFDRKFYLEAGGEISYWPINNNVPSEFKAVDNNYSRYVFSPALQFGYKF